MRKKKFVVYDGADVDALKKARKKGGTPEQMSKNYYIEKRKNQEKKPKYSFVKTPKISHSIKVKKYNAKDTVLDVIRKYRSPRFISNLSNSFSIVMIKSFGKKLTNKEKDFVRSSMALVISETLNKSLEKPLKIIDNIKMFIKVGKVVYKVILKLNEYTREYELDNNIFEVTETNKEYQSFLIEYPKLNNKYSLEDNHPESNNCPLCNSKIELIVEGDKEFYVCSNYLCGKCEYKLSNR